MGLFGCSNKTDYTKIYRPGEDNPSDTEGNLLFDYYAAPVAVVGEAYYDEVTVNEVGGAIYINVYGGDTSGEGETVHSAYKASPTVMNDVMDAVYKYKMESWNGSDLLAIAGAIYVCKFPGDDGELVRVSSENMPEDGKGAFSEVYSVLCGYVIEENKVL